MKLALISLFVIQFLWNEVNAQDNPKPKGTSGGPRLSEVSNTDTKVTI